MTHSPFLETAIKAAQVAEEVIRQYYLSNLDIEVKEDRSPVTVADVETEKAIKKVILDAFPNHGFFGEETGKTNADAEYLWLIDPIDGTKSFVRQYPMFSTQIALMHKGEIIVGVSNSPMFQEMAYAEKGAGAFLNDAPIHVSDITAFEDCALSTGNIATLASKPEAWMALGSLIQQVSRIRGYGDFFHYHLLASGKIDVIVESDVNILDIAALSVIITEAGGEFTDLSGQVIDLDTTTVLATANKTLYQHVANTLKYI